MSLQARILPGLLVLCGCLGYVATVNITELESNRAVELFRRYIRINTAHPSEGNVNYSQAVEFWVEQAASLGLPVRVLEFHKDKPIVIISWPGANSSLPAIMLNHHMDVVAADEEDWIYPPFAAHMDDAGNIYGRGTQDMKSLGIQHLEVIRQLKADNITLQRTVHITAVPDEEIGGAEGMEAFVESEEFAQLNVGFALDEGIAYPNSSYIVFYAERTPWQIRVTCEGPGGHGSTMPADTAASKFRKIIDAFLDYRDEQLSIMTKDPDTDIGSVTTINLTGVSGGIATNIIPDSISATFDMRLAVDIDVIKFNQTLTSWINAGNCSYTYLLQNPVSTPTRLDDSNIYWTAFKAATNAMAMQVIPIVSPGSTDQRFVRAKGVPALGFSPMPDTPYLLHTVNEYVNARTFLEGIRTYYNIIKAVANA